MRSKKFAIGIFMLIVWIVLFTGSTFAISLLTQEKALEQMFPDVDKVVNEIRELTDTELAAIKEKLGGSLVHFQKGSKSEALAELTKYTFYVGIKGDKKIRMAIIDEQPGKWGPVKFIVAIDLITGKVNNLAVMSYKEKRGRPIARENFLQQFLGKGSSDAISVRGEKGVRRDIRAISGATISSDCACFAVKKVIALYEGAFLKDKKQYSQKQ